ncbi:MAG TPA: hypothetical protein VD931_17020 [Baekduia sp.]|nr:hypothetical protein [Baekduia sp.]
MSSDEPQQDPQDTMDEPEVQPDTVRSTENPESLESAVQAEMAERPAQGA